MSRTNTELVYYYSISVTHILDTHRRHTAPKVVHFPELKRCKQTLPNTRISRYVPWKQTFLIRTIYPACCRRQVTFLSSPPLSHRSLTCGTRNIQTLLSKANFDTSIINENHNILPPLLSNIPFKSLRNIPLLRPTYPDDHIRIVFTFRL